MKKSTFTRKTKPTSNDTPTNTTDTTSNTQSNKPNIQTSAPSGIKPSIHTSQLVVSSGLDDFDEILQGGVGVGSLVLIEEDKYTRHYKSLLNYFISEGIATEQAVFICSSIFNTSKSLLSQIPSQQPEEIDVQKQMMEQKAIEEMKIAWRYKSQLKTSEKKKQSMAHNFDLSQPIDEKSLSENKDVHTFDLVPTDDVKNDFRVMFESIKKVLDEYSSYIKENKTAKLCRIAIYSFANAGLYDINNKEYQREALIFLYALKGLLRNSLSACMISVPTHLYPQNDSFVSRLRLLCDTVFTVSSFQDSDVKIPDIYNDFTGVMELKKLSSLNIYSAKLPTVLSYLFTRKRKKLFIEELYIPPEQTSQPSNEEQQRGSKVDIKGSMCATGGNKVNQLDF